MYKCYLNGKLYGQGDLKYITDLFAEYVKDCQLNGTEQREFKVTKIKE